jgi:hypothetical protein
VQRCAGCGDCVDVRALFDPNVDRSQPGTPSRTVP